MAHIAFLSIPYAGHINPTLGVAEELVARGHRATYPVPAEYRSRVEEVGARAIVCDPHIDGFGETTPFDDANRYTTADFVRLLESLLQHAVAQISAWTRALTIDRPHVVVHDVSCWAGRLLAARWRVPAIRCQPLLAWRGNWWTDHDYVDFDRHDDAVVRVTRAVHRLVRRMGSDLTVPRLMADDEEPTLVFLPREFQHGGDAFSGQFHFVGPCLGARRFQGTWRGPGDRPVVLVALGTVHNRRPELFQNCLRAIAGTPWHGVVATGDGVDPERLGPVPDNVEISRSVPQTEVLKAASVFLNHGGMGSIMESLAFGVPVIAVPQMAEQRANADRIVELGLGRRLAPADTGPEALRATVAAVLADPDLRSRVAAMREVIRSAGGAPAAADVVEALLPGRRS